MAVRRRRSHLRGPEGIYGWLFTAPMIIILGLFLFIPIVMALWVSMTNWNGNGSPFVGGQYAQFVGADNYLRLFTRSGLTQSTFMQSLSNNFYYVLLVVPIQTVLALGLALLVNARGLRGKGFFRTAFYFPSVTSAVAISTVFIFLFSNSGAVNAFLKFFGIDGPQWFNDSNGLLHMLLQKIGIDGSSSSWGQHEILGQTVWAWLSGPSVAMSVVIILVIWTTSGTFMLMFLAALQDVPVELEEAAALDGATGWRRLRSVILPLIKPTLFMVLTLGLIGSWQVFDQIYVMGKGAPDGTTLTPAYLAYQTGFSNTQYGLGAAMSFVVFLIIIICTLLQRYALRDRDTSRRARRAAARQRKSTEGVTS
ncbi:carbohydrate ABC transporter permease [Branchiibius sp. NY16-3462-2]|uniref:carbohydrate ABC transporter permease n=1 Tax=Branchiibius sp. NY16-3462-2 TaxID=1807500 RepID=UPI000791F9E9|nr:sugar ABC transporter permease [Branchiibius sp. NY16-3462-2]KYH46369.1 ABC transporter permease [Branchiibius sp. NY16-3462-2]